MKKRGFQPNSRTYTTILNAYAGVRHPLDVGGSATPRSAQGKTISRVSIVYDQAQAYMAARAADCEESAGWMDPDETGLAVDAVPGHSPADNTRLPDVNVGPTNAYLKFLASVRRYSEMDNIFTAMPMSGPLSPDTITYTTMFSAMAESLSLKFNPAPPVDARTATSPVALWARMCRQYLSTECEASSDSSRSFDQTVVLVALRCLVRSDQQAQRTAMHIIDSVWGLPRPALDRNTSLQDLPGKTLPQLPLTIEAATTIMSVCPKPPDRSHYASLFLGRPDLRSQADTPFFIAAIRALSETGDIQDVLDILDSHQPRRPNQWPLSVWHDALTAARWSKKEGQGMRINPDFNAALAVFRRMTQMPHGIEDGQISDDGARFRPNDQQGGKDGVRPNLIAPDAKAFSLLLKIALGRGWREVEQAINVIDHCAGIATEFVTTGPSGKTGSRAWDQELAKDTVRACERMLERRLPPQQVKKLHERIEQARSTLSKGSASFGDRPRSRDRT